MTETYVRRWLINKLRNYSVIIQPIESSGTGLGIPDIYFRTYKRCGWIELKIGKVSKIGEVKLRWEPGQLNWIERDVELNGRIFLFIGIKPNTLMIKRLDRDECRQLSYHDPLIEYANYLEFMDVISGDRIIEVLNH